MNAVEMVERCMRFQNPNIQPPYEHMTVRAEPVPMTTDPVPLPSDAGIEGHQRLGVVTTDTIGAVGGP